MNQLQSPVQRLHNACYTQLSNEIVVIPNLENANFYLLNEAAADLWLSLEEPKTILELAQILAQKYLGYPEEYYKDILEWVEDNRKQGLLLV